MKPNFTTILFDNCDLLDKEAAHLERLASAFHVTGNASMSRRLEATATRLTDIAQNLREAYHAHVDGQVAIAEMAQPK